MKTLSEVISLFPAEVRSKYNFAGVKYTGSLKRMTGVRCPSHGEFSQYAAQFRKGNGCPACGAERRVEKNTTPAQDYITKVTALHGGKYTYDKVCYSRMNAKITVTCPVHGDFSISANHHHYRKQGCGVCEAEAKKTRIVQYRHLSAQSKINNTGKDFFEKCGVSHNSKYTYPEQDYHGAKEKIRAVCPDHGEFTQAAWAHLSGKGCPKCGAYTPKWELELATFVEGLGFGVELNRRILDGQEIDVFVPSKNFGVELHGLRWHTERTRDRLDHFNKWKVAEGLGIRLIQVFEDEWTNNKEVVLNRIKAALGQTENFNARQTLLGVVPSQEAAEFFDAHHSQGNTRASVVYGLRLNGEWVAMASFGKARTGAMVAGDESVWEVIRYASKGRVRGGFSKLFKRFLENYEPEKVLSYCDLRYGTGSLYKATGFELDGITDPDYWWVPDGKVARVPRYQTQKHKMAAHPILKAFYDPSKTEVEICHAAGWYRIYGVGHQRWVWKSA
jgi:hypothetical protein